MELCFLEAKVLAAALQKKPRHCLAHRQCASWIEHIRSMLQDHTFQRRFRMDYPSFKFLYGLLRPKMNRDVEMANLRNGVVAGEWALASNLRWLSGGSYFEMMDGPTIASSTAHSVLHRALEAINSCPNLAIVWPDDDDWATLPQGLGHAAGKASWTATTIPDISLISLCITLPIVAVRVKAICDARYIFTAGCISCSGSTNDRIAWNMTNVKSKVEMLPDGYYIIGDSAYP
ncbi:unnamed protein product, partial [Discosporangium mesarthrocarpum]